MKRDTVLLILSAILMIVVVQSGLSADTTRVQSAQPAAGNQIKWQVISSGGTSGSSENFALNGTIGQTAVGHGSSTNFGLSHGFWQEFGTATCCNHDGIRGDVNYDLGGPNVADLTYVVDYLFRSGPPPPCDEEGDVNGDSNINVADLTYLVDFLFRGGPPPPACP